MFSMKDLVVQRAVGSTLNPGGHGIDSWELQMFCSVGLANPKRTILLHSNWIINPQLNNFFIILINTLKKKLSCVKTEIPFHIFCV